MPFDSIDIPLAVGLREDASDLDLPVQGLDIAENALFRRSGAVTCRPGLVSLNNNQITHSETDTSNLGDLSLVLNDRLGLCGDDDNLLLVEAGQALVKHENSWDQAGPCWSVQAKESPLVGDQAASYLYAPHVGTRITGFFQNAPVANYSTPDGVPAAAGAEVQRWLPAESRCVAGDGLFVSVAGSIYLLSGYPTETTTLVVNNALVSAATQTPQRLWAVPSTSGYFLAYQLAGVAGVRICAVSTVGVVTAFVTITKGQTASGSGLLSLSLAFDNANNALILSVAGVNDQLATYRFNATTLVDSAHDATLSTGLFGEVVTGVVSGFVPGGECFVGVFSDASGDVRLYRRTGSATATALTLHRTLHGDVLNVFQPGLPRWRTWFGPLVFAGRLVMGVYHLAEAGALDQYDPATALVIDVTSATVTPCVYATRENLVLAPRAASSAVSLLGKLSFAYLEGTRFDLDGVHSPRCRRVDITTVPPQSATANGLVHLSGQVSYCFDGQRCFEAGWLIRPGIRVRMTTGGSVDVGSRTFSACLVYVDAQGNQHRSAPAIKKTVLVGLGTQVANVDVTLPQVTSRFAKKCFVEVYVSAPNPAPEADLYLVDAPSPIATFDAPFQTVVMSSENAFRPLSTGQILYTGGGILPSERPLANAGFASVGSRLWCAEGQQAFASKYIQPGEAPAWSISSDSLQLTVPSGYGPIEGLGGIDNLLIILCRNGACVFTGAGPGDEGGPSDFTEPRLVYKAAGPSRPCDVTLARDAVVWTSSKGDAHALGQGSQGSNISRQVANKFLSRPCFVPGSRLDHDLLVFWSYIGANELVVFDTELQQWGTWMVHAYPRDIFATAEGLNALFDVDPYVGAYTAYGASADASVPPYDISLHVRTRLIPLGRLGRVKSIMPLGRASDDGVSITQSVLSDRSRQALAGNSKSYVLSSATPKWPREELPELRLGKQRMESFAVDIVATPGNVELKAVQARVMQGTENPRNNRK